MILTEEEIALWLHIADEPINFARAIESAVLEKLKAQNPFAYFSINDYGAWEETSDPTAHALYEHPLPPDDVVRDAERYRWLRNQERNPDFYSDQPYWEASRVQPGTGHIFRKENLDAAIDAAMKGEK